MADSGPDRPAGCVSFAGDVHWGTDRCWWGCPLLVALSDGARRPVGDPGGGSGGVSRQTVHTWPGHFRDRGLGGLVDRSHRPEFCPHQSPFEVESAVCELRRVRPRWGPRRRAPGAHVQRADRGGEQPDQSGSSKWRSASGASRATGSGRCSTPAASTGTYSPRSHAAEVRRAPLPRPAPSSSSILGLPGSRLLAARCDRRSRMDLDVVVDFPARCAMGSQDRPGEF
jgi:leucine-zipper of insertion element IS481